MSDWTAGDEVQTFTLQDGGAVVVRFHDENDQQALNAAEIWEGSKNGLYRELKDQRLECDKDGTILARTYVGKDDDGEVRHWLYTPPFRLQGRRVPASAVQHPDANDPRSWACVAQCRRCKDTYVVYAGSRNAFLIGNPELGNVTDS